MNEITLADFMKAHRREWIPLACHHMPLRDRVLPGIVTVERRMEKRQLDYYHHERWNGTVTHYWRTKVEGHSILLKLRDERISVSSWKLQAWPENGYAWGKI